jgi:hypothetical protein
MKLLSLLALIFVWSLPKAFAVDSSCPVKFTQVRNIQGSFFVSLQNTTGVDITSYDVDISFVDIQGRTHLFPFPLLLQERIAAGQNKVAQFISPDALQFLFPVINTSLFKIEFADGSEWIDDGSHPCSFMSLEE